MRLEGAHQRIVEVDLRGGRVEGGERLGGAEGGGVSCLVLRGAVEKV